LRVLRENAMRGLTVVALAQQGKQIPHHKQCGWYCKEQAADHWDVDLGKISVGIDRMAVVLRNRTSAAST